MVLTYFGTVTLGVMQPAMQADFGISDTEALWIINIYMLALALCTAPAGRLADRYGHRRLGLAGVALIALGSLLGALTTNYWGLLASLGLQGVGAAPLYPVAAAVISANVAGKNLGRAMGTWGSLGTLTLGFIPLIAGVITDTVSWRLVFGIAVVGAAAVYLIGAIYVDDDKARPDPAPAARPKWDYTGTAALFVGLSCLLVGIMQALVWTWTSAGTIALIVAGVVVLTGFVIYELRSADPLLNLGLMKDKIFAAATIVLFFVQFVVTSYVIYMTTFYQAVFGLSAMAAGAFMLLNYGFVSLNSPAGGRLTDRHGPRPATLLGLACLVVAPLLVTLLAGLDNFWIFIPSLLALGAAQGYAFSALIPTASHRLAPEVRGQGQGLVTTVRWVGGALGTTVLGVAIAHINVIKERTEDTVQASIDGYRFGFLVATVFAAAGLVLAAILVRQARPARTR